MTKSLSKASFSVLSKVEYVAKKRDILELEFFVILNFALNSLKGPISFTGSL